MKYLKLLLILLLVIGCAETKEDSTNGNRTDKKQIVFQPFNIDLVGVDNLIVQNVVNPDQSVMFASYEGGNLFYNKDGELFTVDLPVGFFVKKVKDVKNSNNIAITFYVDASSDTLTATCIVNLVDQICDPGLWEPRKMSRLGNSPFLHENNGKLRYLTNNSMVTIDMVTDEKMTAPFAANGQISINDNGNMMIDTGTEISISASFDMVLPDIMEDSLGSETLNISPNYHKFFLPHKSGFLLRTGVYHDFVRFSDNNGSMELHLAQEIAYYKWLETGDVNDYNRIHSQSSLSNCTSHIVGDDDIMICNDDIYLLGDASNDMSHKNINYSGHLIYDLTIKAGNSLYMYSKNNMDASADYFRLSKEDVINEVSTTITTDYEIIPGCFDVNKGSSDTLDIGALRVSDNEQVILKITTADATPDIIETLGECDQIVSF